MSTKRVRESASGSKVRRSDVLPTPVGPATSTETPRVSANRSSALMSFTE
jgi:hypothetical protein